MVPSLNLPRYNHSSCASENSVYVFGGLNCDTKDSSGLMNSVEVLNLDLQAQPMWKLFYVEFKSNSARHSSILCSVSSDSIMIVGGESFGPLSNGIIVNTKTGKEKHIVLEKSN